MKHSVAKNLVRLFTWISPTYRRIGNVEKRLRKDLGLEIASTQICSHYSGLAALDTRSGVTEKKRSPELIVSLTTIPERIQTVHLAIESVFQQCLQADRVILWLDEENFAGMELPHSLRRAEDRGLEICWCENIRQYKKLLPTLKAYPSAVIVTMDDDALYPVQWLYQLYTAHTQEPDSIHAQWARRIWFNSEGELAPYHKWPSTSLADDPPPTLTYPVGIGGILYPPGSLPDTVFDSDTYNRLCPKSNDTWLFAQAVLGGTLQRPLEQVMKVSVAPYWLNIMDIPGTQHTSLSSLNLGGNAYAKALPATFKGLEIWDDLRTADRQRSLNLP